MSQFGGPGGGGYGGPPGGGGGYGGPPGGGGYGGPPGGGYGGPPGGGPPGGGYGAPDPYGNQSGMGPPMGGNPYSPPAGGYDPMGGGGDPSIARAKCGPPAITMMVTTGIGMAFAVLRIILNAIGSTAALSGMGSSGGAVMVGGVGILFGLFHLAVGGFCIYGLLKMQQAQSWGLALGAVIASMVPCVGPCCILNMFIGIWALVVLNDSSVKNAFRN